MGLFKVETIFGSESIERVLLFLFVNEKGYGTQMSRLLGVPLTPIQKALGRLEKGRVIESYCEGKTRLYQFNRAYPLLTELKQFLKKGYTLLPAQEKKRYHIPAETQLVRPHETIALCWELLKQVGQVRLSARSHSDGWNRRGMAEVHVEKRSDHVMIFNERGSWGEERVEFTNVFRWTIDRHACLITLEHLRFGEERPVLLLHLTPAGPRHLTSIDAHLCGEDTYFGHLQFDEQTIRLHWRVIGAKKNEEIDYYYTNCMK